MDYFEGNTYVSLVGIYFTNSALKGISISFYLHFEEFNLRFYVRFKQGNTWKRRVVFIKEIVPKRMITYVARLMYGEHYHYHPQCATPYKAMIKTY